MVENDLKVDYIKSCGSKKGDTCRMACPVRQFKDPFQQALFRKRHWL